MAIELISLIKPKNGGAFPTHEDSDCKGGYHTCASTTARDAIPAANRKEGMVVFTIADGGEWRLEADLTTWSALHAALSVTDWYISFLSGSDANSGVVIGSPLKTVAELFHRWGSRSPQFTGRLINVFVLDHDSTDAITGELNCLGVTTVVNIQGISPVVLKMGTFTAVTSENTATGTHPAVTDGVTAWTPGTRIRLTSGTSTGAVAWVSADRGGGVAWTTDFMNVDVDPLAILTPSVGDAYTVEALTQIYVNDLRVSGVGVAAQVDTSTVAGVQARDVVIGGDPAIGVIGVGGNLGLTLVNSKFDDSSAVIVGYDGLLNFYNAFSEGAEIIILRSTFVSYGGGGLGVGSGTAIVFDRNSHGRSANFIGQNYALSVGAGSTCVFSAPVGNFESTASTLNPGGDGLVIGEQHNGADGYSGRVTCAYTGMFWGTGNAGVGVAVINDSSFVARSATPCTATGALGNIRLGRDTADLSGVSYFSDKTQTLPFMCSWANLAKYGSIHNPNGDTHIISVGSTPLSPPLQQATWAVDPSNSTGVASDNNPGTALLPLLTWNELSRRVPDWTGLDDVVTILAMSDGANTDQWVAQGVVASAGVLLVFGTQQVFKTGTLSAKVDHAGKIPNSATDSLGAAWTHAGEGYFLKITNGVHAGLMAPMLKDLGGGVVRLGDWILPSASMPSNTSSGYTILGTETYAVVRPVYMPPVVDLLEQPVINLNASVTYEVGIQYHDLFFSHLDVNTGIGSAFKGGIAKWFINCCNQFSMVLQNQISDTWFSGHQNVGVDGSLQLERGYYQYTGGTIIDSTWGLICTSGATCQMDANCIVQNSLCYAANGAFLNPDNVGVFDCAAEAPFQALPNGVLYFAYNTIYGSNNSAPIVEIYPWGQGQYTGPGCFADVDPSTGASDILLNGATSVAVMRADTGAFQAPLALTFAHLFAAYGTPGFGGSVVDLKTGTSFVLTT